MSIEDLVSEPVNPAGSWTRSTVSTSAAVLLKPRQCRAKDKGVDSGIIDEYSVFRKGIEKNKNLLVILKKSGGTCHSGRTIRAEEPAAISRLGEKIRSDEDRLNEINGKFNAGIWAQILRPRIGSVRIFK